jgi:hypothetical protein
VKGRDVQARAASLKSGILVAFALLLQVLTRFVRAETASQP